MAIESDKISESFLVPSPSSENLGSSLLNDFESYWQDINDRLIISRVVSDSVIKGMVNAVSQEADEVISARDTEVTRLKEHLLEGQMVQQLQAELEVIVMQNAAQNVREEYKREPLNCQSCVGKTIQDKLKVVLSTCQDLDAVQKSLFSFERLSSHGSLEIDHIHCKVLTNDASPDIRHKESSVNLPENFDSSRLKHLTIDELYSHFRDVITELKRDHETTVLAITEEYFSLKREFLKDRELLKERGCFLPHKSKDFDTMRNKIPDIISKLNDILSDIEDSSKTCDLSRDALDNLLVENHNLRDLLNGKKMEIKCLSLQVSEAEGKLTQHVLDKACHSKTIRDLKMSLEEANMEASVSEEVYNCIIRELISQIRCVDEEGDMRSITMQDTLAIVYKEAIHEAEGQMRLEYGEFLDMQATTLQDVSGIIFQEALRDLAVQLKSLKKVCLRKDELIASLESKASDMEKTLALEAQEKRKLKQSILELEEVIEAKDTSLITEKEQFEKVLNETKDLTTHREDLVFQRNSELEIMKANLGDSLQQINQYEVQIDKLTKALELVQLDSKRVIEERNKTCLLFDAKDREYREQIESAVHVAQEMTKAFVNFELRTIESMKWNNVRLENSTFQLDRLVKKVNVLRRTGLLYKQRLERRCSDLQKAEAEVDLLGDEVETFLALLQKIYIALDHYAPILQHYPGIMEILKLVDRKLSAEYAKSICATPY